MIKDSIKQFLNKLNQASLDASHCKYSPLKLYYSVIRSANKLSDSDIRNDAKDNLSTYLLDKHGKLYHRTDIESPWKLADDDDLTDDLDEVYESVQADLM